MPKLIHYTEGGVWHGYTKQEFAREWTEELASLLGGANPCAYGEIDATNGKINIKVSYEQKSND